jgi:predicted naringenin-chalcone synthase
VTPASLPVLTQFHAARPRHELTQQASLDWLTRAHAASGRDDVDDALVARIARVIARCACAPDKIARRGVSIADPLNASWADNVLYDVPRDPHGKGTAERTRLFERIVDDYFTVAYAGDDAPDDLIHVTCTGYVSPSGAQKLVARRGWPTRVTHAYHMGCYAAVPAIRMAAGFAASRVDIAHTELCSLHFDPTDHRIEQLVVQSLFADGLIRYSLVRDADAAGLRVLALHEAIAPDSADAMGWLVGDHGMQMTLARDVPDRIAGVVRGFVVELFRRGGSELGRMRDSQFAIHPGGPKIIDRVTAALELSDAQVATSRGVLLDHGNMSSATLPHVWMRLLADPGIAPGTLIPSLAFGPGLTIVGALLEKR